jgi:hypothetical protein
LIPRKHTIGEATLVGARYMMVGCVLARLTRTYLKIV